MLRIKGEFWNWATAKETPANMLRAAADQKVMRLRLDLVMLNLQRCTLWMMVGVLVC